VATIVDRLGHARRELDTALEEKDAAQQRFDASVGTSAEWAAYQRLRRAGRNVTLADRELKQAAADVERELPV
jgi:hypothetical protein